MRFFIPSTGKIVSRKNRKIEKSFKTCTCVKDLLMTLAFTSMGGALRRMAIHGQDAQDCRDLAELYGWNRHSSVRDLQVNYVHTNERIENGKSIQDEYFYVVGDKLRTEHQYYSALGVIEDEGLLWKIHESSPSLPLIFWTTQNPMPEFDWPAGVLVLPYLKKTKAVIQTDSDSDYMDDTFEDFHNKHAMIIHAFLDACPSRVELMPPDEFFSFVLNDM